MNKDNLTTDDLVQMIQRAMEELSPEHMAALDHVSIIVADQPSPEQAEALKLRGDQLLLGLFEGVPRTMRTGYESGLGSDTITLFRLPLLAISHDEAGLYQQVKRTVWHEIAHYFGIDHDHMAALQRKDNT